ncbi:uncharacterized protein LOC120788821 isoform X5 [Xiphias gladius]|nr:uncharacterized protein LOC120788821 isoform X5 [Xiphias gladius]
MTALNDGVPGWFSEVFVVQPCSHRDSGDVSKMKEVSAMQKNERKETTKKRKLALQTKKERATLPSDSMGVVKTKKNKHSSGDCYPICTEIGLDLEVASKSGDKEKLDLKLLTRAVVMEIYKFAVKKVGHYFPGIVYDILDYNFDLSSQHYRRWEFSIATASKVKTMVKQYRKNLHRAGEVFKLPFVFERKATKRLEPEGQNTKSTESSMEEPDKTTNEEGRFVRHIRYHSDVNRVYFLDVKTNEEPWFDNEDTKPLTDPGSIMQMNVSPVSGGCDGLLQGNIRIKEEEYDPQYGYIKPEPDAEKKYHPHCEVDKTESNTKDVKYLVHGEPAGSLGYTLITICPKSGSNIKSESETEDVQCYNLAEPQVSEGYAMLAVCPNTESSVKTESGTEGVKYVVPVEAAGFQGYPMMTMCQVTETTSIKEEQENVPVESYRYEAVSNTE